MFSIPDLSDCVVISGFTGKSWLSPSVQQGHLLHRGQQGQRGGQGEAQEGEAGGGDQARDSEGRYILDYSVVSCYFIIIINTALIYSGKTQYLDYYDWFK